MPEAIVVGGGLAGCAAAVRLSAKGWRVTLLERHPRLGGKVSSFRHAGAWVDNGQHVLTKACTELRAFLKEIGAEGKVRWQERLRVPFVSAGGKVTVLSRWDLPAPLHLAPGLLSFDLLPFSERLALRRALDGCREELPDTGTFRTWLESRGQSERAIRRFWDPLVYTVCNASSAEVGAESGAWTARQAFLNSPDALDLGIPAVPQAELAEPGVRAFLSARGGTVRMGAVVEAVSGREVRLRDGETLRADAVVLAVPWEAASTLLPGRLDGVERLKPSAILSVVLQMDRPVLPEGEGFVGLVDSPVQWAFAKGEGVLSLVVSGANALMHRSSGDLVAMSVEALKAALPRMADAVVKNAIVMKEKRATFLPAPGSSRLRPKVDAAGLPGLALAGAWTDTGWPATMEGAVRSGNAAAEWVAGQTE